MCKRLLDRNAIVTGGARGMGYAIAKALFEEGARVAIIDVDDKGVTDAAKRLDSKYGRVLGKRIDVTIKSEIQDMVKEIRSLWGSIDILVNNAGALNTPYILEEIEEKDWNLVVDVNLKGPSSAVRQ
jgi:3-oxoacyl-[acyl-carrier protein] reductase